MGKSNKKQIKRQEKDWLDSYDGIYYQLPCLSTPSDDRDEKKIIAKTLERLPVEIREEVITEVIFIYSSWSGFVSQIFISQHLKDSEIKKDYFGDYIEIQQPIIILNFKEMEKNREMDYIAHEIAHFILRHYSMENRNNPYNEREADNLIDKWGFKRIYKKKDYQNFEKANHVNRNQSPNKTHSRMVKTKP